MVDALLNTIGPLFLLIYLGTVQHARHVFSVSEQLITLSLLLFVYCFKNLLPGMIFLFVLSSNLTHTYFVN